MNMDAVIGCASVEAGGEWLRLKTATGTVRTIPWTAVMAAGMGLAEHSKITIQGVTEKVAPYLATHDTLWIFSGTGEIAQVMIEKQGPEREVLLGAMVANLGKRWHGNDLPMAALTEMLFRIPAPVKMPKILIVMMIVMGLVVLAAMAVLMFVRGK